MRKTGRSQIVEPFKLDIPVQQIVRRGLSRELSGEPFTLTFLNMHDERIAESFIDQYRSTTAEVVVTQLDVPPTEEHDTSVVSVLCFAAEHALGLMPGRPVVNADTWLEFEPDAALEFEDDAVSELKADGWLKFAEQKTTPNSQMSVLLGSST